MSKSLILGIIIFGVIITIIALIIILKKSSKKEVVEVKHKQPEMDEFYFDDLMAIAKNPNTKSNDLLNALIYFNENFVIDDTNSKEYLIFLSRVLTHPNKSKNIFQYFHNEVKPKNKSFKNELESIEMKALG
jgi:hypothetical protein